MERVRTRSHGELDVDAQLSDAAALGMASVAQKIWDYEVGIAAQRILDIRREVAMELSE